MIVWVVSFGSLAAATTVDDAGAVAQVKQLIAHRGASAERPECTTAAIRRAIDVGATAVEVDVRTSQDGQLFILHDSTLDRTTNGKGPAGALTLAQLQQLDAGSWFGDAYRGERIPSLAQSAEICRGKIDLLLDLKEQGDEYDRKVVALIRKHGDPARTIVGVRSVAQAKRFRQLLPDAKQLALIPTADDIEAFASAGADCIRLWPRWLIDNDEPVKRVRASGKQLHLNGTTGGLDETQSLLVYRPDSLSSDDPRKLRETLKRIAKDGLPRRYSHPAMAARIQALNVPSLESAESIRRWQVQRRERFVQRMLYPYQGKMEVVEGEVSDAYAETFRQQEFYVNHAGERLFRYYRLEPKSTTITGRHPAIVCFMGHGTVKQVLAEQDSYQHACAANFAKAGYLVFVMENIGMEPEHDSHLDLDRVHRLEGYGWYSLLFAHQRILLEQVFSDPLADPQRVGVTGVSTGGLLALTAAAMEPRVAAASVQGIFGSMRVSFVRDRDRHCSCGAIPGLLPEFDLPELALLIAPRPLHFANGVTDGFTPQEAERCRKLIEPIYLRAGGSRPQLTVAPGGHAFAFKAAHDFFHSNLN